MATSCGVRVVTQACRLRGGLLRPSYSILRSVRLANTATGRKLKDGEDFWKKNERMDRPMSPHLTIYKFQLPAVMSVSHRATGIALTGVTSLVAVAALVLPGSIPHYLELIQGLGIPYALIFSAKCALIFPFWYHTANGVRHLFWDTGRGFDMKRLYKTGYAVVLSSLLATVGTVAYFSM